MKLFRAAASVSLFIFAALLLVPGCLRSLELHPVSTPAGPGVEGCVTIASASPSAAPTVIASASPKAGPGL